MEVGVARAAPPAVRAAVGVRLVEVHVRDRVGRGAALEHVLGQVVGADRVAARVTVEDAAVQQVAVLGRDAVLRVAVDALETLGPRHVGAARARRRGGRPQRVAVDHVVAGVVRALGRVGVEATGLADRTGHVRAEDVRSPRLLVVAGEAQFIDVVAEQVVVGTTGAQRREDRATHGVAVALAVVRDMAVAAHQVSADVEIARHGHSRQAAEGQDDEGKHQALHGFTPQGV